MCIAAPSVRATKTRQRELISHAQRSAATISARLGWTGSARGT
jgi:DNA-binding IclR family transcriptional regulator